MRRHSRASRHRRASGWSPWTRTVSTTLATSVHFSMRPWQVDLLSSTRVRAIPLLTPGFGTLRHARPSCWSTSSTVEPTRDCSTATVWSWVTSGAASPPTRVPVSTLDIALSWVVGTPVTASVPMRDEGDRTSGYSLRTLVSHFWRMVLTGGTRALRLVSLMGLFFAIGGLTLAAVLVVNKLTGANVIAGWTSLAVVLLVCTGVMLLSLGVIAEYLGVAVNMAMGRPPYLITRDPMSGPLGDSDQSRGTYDRA